MKNDTMTRYHTDFSVDAQLYERHRKLAMSLIFIGQSSLMMSVVTIALSINILYDTSHHAQYAISQLRSIPPVLSRISCLMLNFHSQRSDALFRETSER